MNIYKRIIRLAYKVCGPGSPIMLSHTGDVQSTRLGVSAVPICQRPGGFLENCWSSVCIGSPKKPVLTLVKECQSNSIDELTRRREGKQTQGSFLLLCPYLPGLAPEDAAHIKDGSSHFTLSGEENFSQECLAADGLVDSRSSQFDKQD